MFTVKEYTCEIGKLGVKKNHFKDITCEIGKLGIKKNLPPEPVM